MLNVKMSYVDVSNADMSNVDIRNVEVGRGIERGTTTRKLPQCLHTVQCSSTPSNDHPNYDLQTVFLRPREPSSHDRKEVNGST